VKKRNEKTKRRNKYLVCGIAFDTSPEVEVFKGWVAIEEPEFLGMIDKVEAKWKVHQALLREDSEPTDKRKSAKRKAEEVEVTESEPPATPTASPMAAIMVTPAGKDPQEELLELKAELASMKCAQTPVAAAASMPTEAERKQEAEMELLALKIQLAECKLAQQKQVAGNQCWDGHPPFLCNSQWST